MRKSGPEPLAFARTRLHGKPPFLAALAFVTWLGVAICGGAWAAEESHNSDLPQAAAGQLRSVWVLTDTPESTSEGGPKSSSPGPSIVPYEIQCVFGQLRSAQRGIATVGLYGVPVYTVRLRASLSSQEGADALRATLERVCKM